MNKINQSLLGMAFFGLVSLQAQSANVFSDGIVKTSLINSTATGIISAGAQSIEGTQIVGLPLTYAFVLTSISSDWAVALSSIADARTEQSWQVDVQPGYYIASAWYGAGGRYVVGDGSLIGATPSVGATINLSDGIENRTQSFSAQSQSLGNQWRAETDPLNYAPYFATSMSFTSIAKLTAFGDGMAPNTSRIIGNVFDSALTQTSGQVLFLSLAGAPIAPVPEPSAWLSLLIGGVVVASIVKRKNRQSAKL